jgi:hypothetical protein
LTSAKESQRPPTSSPQRPAPKLSKNQLFAAVIPTAVAAQELRGRRRRYQEADVKRWLRNLARHLETRTDLALHRLWQITGHSAARKLHGLTVGILAGLAGGLAVGLKFGLANGPAVGLKAGLVFGLYFGLPLAIMVERRQATLPQKLPLRSHHRASNGGGSRLRRLRIALFAFGLGVGMLAGLASGLPFAYALAIGLALGLPFALAVGLGDESTNVVGRSERRLIREDMAYGLAFGSLAGLALGLAFGLLAAHALGLMVGIMVGLAFALTVGLAFGLSLGAASGRYCCAVLLFLLGARKTFPARPARFLNWAENSGLLRATGAAYQYRHETYRSWLAEQNYDGIVNK